MTDPLPIDSEVPLTADEARDRYLRALADLDNLRKRKIKEVEDARDQGEAHVARTLLPIVDDMARALQAMSQVDGHETWSKEEVLAGWRNVFEKFIHLLKTLEIEGLQAEGQRFTADLMEAVLQVPSKLAPGTVVAQISQGFTRRGRLLQPAMVAVAVAEEET